MDMFAPKHLLVVLMIVLLVFGGKKIKTLGSDLGSAIRGFKKSVAEGEGSEPSSPTPSLAAASNHAASGDATIAS